MSEDMSDVMFICGAQGTPDGDMLPGSFTVFSRLTGPEEAVNTIVGKIIEDLVELEIGDAAGSIVFLPIRTWQEWADVAIDEHIKMKALAGSIAIDFMVALSDVDDERVTELASLGWVPSPE